MKPLQTTEELSYRIKEHSWIARIAAYKLGVKSVAIVLGSTIYLYGVGRAEFEQCKSWLRHELVHVRQFNQYGFLPFICKYLAECMRKGYYNNKYEVEARAAEQE